MKNENQEILLNYLMIKKQRKEVLNNMPEKIDTITVRFSNEWLNLSKLISIPWHTVKNGFSITYTYTVEEGLNLMKRESEFNTFCKKKCLKMAHSPCVSRHLSTPSL